jgi:4-hydroxythreonine-4-phosphate dehydrogenase
MSKLIKIGITHGDVNGIGYEVLLKTFSDTRLLELFTSVIYGSSKSASYHRKALNFPPPNFHIISKVEDIHTGKINLLNCIKEEIKIDLGKPTAEAGAAAYVALNDAVRDLQEKQIDVLVTLPITKDTIQSDKFRFRGHTDFLESRFSQNGEKALMMMITDNFRIALVTSHTAILDVSRQITFASVLEKIKTLNHSLKRDFRIENPRIAVLGLNPHAGENGLLGEEEVKTINPAIKEAQSKGILCVGPFAADSFFGAGKYKEFDAVLAMYHDQGLIPFKTFAMESGVNYTAGLPIVRTSPDHGTAYGIVGKGEASDESFRQAMYAAVDIFKNRKAYDEAHANPLRKMFFDKGKDDERLDLTT